MKQMISKHDENVIDVIKRCYKQLIATAHKDGYQLDGMTIVLYAPKPAADMLPLVSDGYNIPVIINNAVTDDGTGIYDLEMVLIPSEDVKATQGISTLSREKKALIVGYEVARELGDPTIQVQVTEHGHELTVTLRNGTHSVSRIVTFNANHMIWQGNAAMLKQAWLHLLEEVE